MSKNKNNTVWLVAGEGGHLSQAIRFLSGARGMNTTLVVISERTHVSVDGVDQLIQRPNFSSYSKSPSVTKRAFFYLLFLREFLYAPIMLIKHRPDGIVFFGPAFCIPIAIWAKAFRIKGVFIEDWSKFNSKTKTGQLMALLSYKIYVQHLSLLSVYPRATYSGKL
jgi:beta-1,4-N-acetylglucosaminyltransferase